MHHRSVEYSSSWLVPGVILPAGPNFHEITLTWDRNHPEAVGWQGPDVGIFEPDIVLGKD